MTITIKFARELILTISLCGDIDYLFKKYVEMLNKKLRFAVHKFQIKKGVTENP
jgi:hypothetical protein